MRQQGWWPLWMRLLACEYSLSATQLPNHSHFRLRIVQRPVGNWNIVLSTQYIEQIDQQTLTSFIGMNSMIKTSTRLAVYRTSFFKIALPTLGSSIDTISSTKLYTRLCILWLLPNRQVLMKMKVLCPGIYIPLQMQRQDSSTGAQYTTIQSIRQWSETLHMSLLWSQ